MVLHSSSSPLDSDSLLDGVKDWCFQDINKYCTNYKDIVHTERYADKEDKWIHEKDDLSNYQINVDSMKTGNIDKCFDEDKGKNEDLPNKQKFLADATAMMIFNQIIDIL